VRARVVLAMVVLAVGAAVAPPVAAEGFAVELPFTDVTTASHLPVLSGRLDVRTPAGGAPAVLHDVAQFEVDGLAVVCWEYPCHEAQGKLVVQVFAGSTVALRFPTAGVLELHADHGVASPVGLDARRAGFGELAAALQMAPSLAATTKGGVLSVLAETVQPPPDGAVPAQAPPGMPPQLASSFQAPDPDDADAAVLATLTPGSRVQVVDDGHVVYSFRGFGGLLLQGPLHVPPVHAAAFVLPCAVRCEVLVADDGAEADLRGAMDTILGLVALAQGAPALVLDLGPFADLLDPLAGGVFIDVPLVADPSQFTVANLTLVRFDRLQVALYPDAPPSPGSGPLVIQSGDVQGAPAFVGGPYFAMPLWSYLLWGAAIIALVLAAVTRSPKRNPRWDRLQWVGRVVGALALLALLLVWHLNFARVVGVDVTSPGLGGGSRMLIGAIEAGTFLAMLLIVVLPTRILLSRSFRLGRQGRFMGLAGPLASVVGILAGTPLLLGFVDLALQLFQ
jgi:hypothetical protein